MTSPRWQELSTASVPYAQRMRRWLDFGSDTLGELHVSPVGRCPFEARLQRIEIGSMGLAFLQSTPVLVSSTAANAGAWAAPHQDALLMTFVDHGSCTVSQGRWSAALGEGDMVVVDLAKPWRNESTRQLGLSLVKIPFATIAQKVADPERIVGCGLAAQLAPVALATSVIRASRQALLSDPAGEWHDLLSEMFLDLFRLVCEGTPSQEEIIERQAPHAVSRNAIRYILRNLHDPNLGVGRVAENLGVSVRHLQRAFLAGGKTPRQFILDQRLERAARMILAADGAGGSRITDIAFSVGFNDVSHFSRSFSNHFGCAPRLYRKTDRN